MSTQQSKKLTASEKSAMKSYPTRRKENNQKEIHIDSTVRTIALKFYDEQLPKGEKDLRERILLINCKEFQVLAIRHDKDTVKDNGDPFKSAIEKPHWHLIARTVDNKSLRVRQWLEMFGVEYRPDVDRTLWEKDGVDTVEDFAAYAVYLTHETAKAIKAGKFQYELEEIVSNLSVEEIKQVRQGYKRLTTEEKRPSLETFVKLDEQALKLGFEFGDFDELYDAQSFAVRNSSKMKTVCESYTRGLEKRLSETDVFVTRLSVFIRGSHNCGKTYAAVNSFNGKKVLTIETGKTGKFDKLKPSTDAIVVSDQTVSDPLALADNKVVSVYRRNRNNQPWCGSHFIVTSNLFFNQWADKCGVSDDEESLALRSRFYVCEIRQNPYGQSYLYCLEESTRGSEQEREERHQMWKDFRDNFNQIIANYQPKEKEQRDDLNTQFPDWTKIHYSADEALSYYQAFNPAYELGDTFYMCDLNESELSQALAKTNTENPTSGRNVIFANGFIDDFTRLKLLPIDTGYPPYEVILTQEEFGELLHQFEDDTKNLIKNLDKEREKIYERKNAFRKIKLYGISAYTVNGRSESYARKVCRKGATRITKAKPFINWRLQPIAN